MENVTTKFPEALKELRGKTTKKEAADGIGISRVALGYYESGERKPDIEVLSRIAEYYHVSTDYLLGLTEVRNPDTQIRGIAKITGLPQAAIDTIQKYKEDAPDLVVALGFLIANDDFRVALENMSKYEYCYMRMMYYFTEYEKASGKITDDLRDNIYTSNDAESATEFRINKYFQDAVDTWIIEKQKQVNAIPSEELKTAFASLIESML